MDPLAPRDRLHRAVWKQRLMRWFHVENYSPGPLTLRIQGKTWLLTVPPGRWCYSWDKEPHCQPKEGDG